MEGVCIVRTKTKKKTSELLEKVHSYAGGKRKTSHLEKPLEHDVYDLVLLVDVVQLHEVLQGVQLILPLRLKQPLV